MSSRVLLITFLLAFLAIVGAMAQENEGKKNSFLGLPFLELTNGGIRFNFGGYHAEAGLGGLLGDSRAGGGLHASAGTPWGAHAAAGLGGTLGGNDATAGGGLYARAGLGNGRPEAAAGLGGALDGSGRSRSAASGGLFAGATLDGRGSDGASGNGGAPTSGASASAEGVAASSKSSAGRTNIQIVSGAEKNGQKLKEIRRETERPASAVDAIAGIFGELQVNPASGDLLVVKSIRNGKGTYEDTRRDGVPFASNANSVVEVDNLSANSLNPRPHSRWHLRKRLWSRIPKKHIVYASSAEADAQGNSVSSLDTDTHRIVTRQSEYVPTDSEQPVIIQESRNRDRGTIEDIFNIPQSTLTAVSQLLQNNGK